MIQLSSLPASSQKSPENSVVCAGHAGDFASHLAGETGEGGPATGKTLPAGGKTLPLALPGQPRAAKFSAKVPAKQGVREDAAAEPGSHDRKSGAGESEAAPGLSVAAAAVEAQGLHLAVGQVPLPPSMAATSEAAAEFEGEHPSRGASGRSKLAEAVAANLRTALKTKGSDGEPQAPEESSGPAEPSAADRKPPNQASLPPEFKQSHPDLADKAPSGRLPQDEAHKGVSSPQPRAGQTSSIVLPLTPAAAPAHAGEAANPVNAFKPDFAAIGSQQGIRPQDFTTLIDRLFEARESARGGSVDLSVMHAEFGEVSLRFHHESGNLSVSMASHDPDFARAVNAATPGDRPHTGEAPFQQGGRQDGGNPSFARGDGGTNASAGDGRAERHLEAGGRPADEAQADPAPEARGPRGGIYA